MTVTTNTTRKERMITVKVSLLYWLFIVVADAEVQVHGIAECRNSVDGKGTWSGNFKEDPARLDFTMNIPFDLKEGDTFKMTAHLYNPDSDEWEYDKQQQDGEICLYMRQFLLKAWDKVRSSSNPKIEEECQISEGTYEWTDLHLESDDVPVPPLMEGKRYKLEFIPYNENDEAVFCVQVDVET